MTLAAGAKLGPYEILAPIGAGGMGEVYKARDTRLDRIVAVKVSKTEFNERFEREARAIATLNHPHICTLYDVGPNYLVMEYVEGVPLKGPLPLDQALKYAAEICDALDAAHKKNITHRDLKPANILVTKSSVKLLDFGLAKVGTPLSAGEGTITMALTGKGEILGTFQYMSPEQINGQDAGPPSDIFSFGLVLYEMLTGKRAFDGSTPASVIAAILERPAPSVADVAPPALDRVLKRCLEKDPENRWQSARDLKAALELATVGQAAGQVPDPPSQTRGLRHPAWAAAAIFALALAALAFVHFREKPPVSELTRFQIPPPDKVTLGNQLSLSPDGRRLAFTARGANSVTQIWVRSLETLEARPLTGTDGVDGLFWSPDSRFIGFGTVSKLKKVDASERPGAVCVRYIGDHPRRRLGPRRNHRLRRRIPSADARSGGRRHAGSDYNPRRRASGSIPHESFVLAGREALRLRTGFFVC
jgi:serine/threonine protein kinase